MDPAVKKPALRRVISTPMLALYGIGNIIGAGIYVLVGKVAEPAGYLSVLAFLLAGVVAFCAALSYAELAARFPVSAGVSIYLHEAFKFRWLSLIVGVLLVAAGIVSTATLLKGFAGYLFTLLPVDPAFLMAGMMAILVAVSLKGIKESVTMAAALTIIEVAGLLFLIASILFARPDAIASYSHHFIVAADSIDAAVFAGVVSAAFIAFYAFVGFEDMVNVAEEVKNPQQAFPRAILLSMMIVSLLYILVTVVTLGVVTPQQLGDNSAPLAFAYTAATGQTAVIITVVSVLATLNGVLVNLIMGSRYLYGMANKSWISTWFAKVSRFGVPSRGLLIVAACALGAALWLPIERLAQTTSLLLLFVFFAVNVSLIAVRRRNKNELTKLRVSPWFMPWLGALLSVMLLVGQAIVFFVSS